MRADEGERAPAEGPGWEEGPVGLFVAGALGDVATTMAVGLEALRRGLVPPVGLVSAREPALAAAGLPPLHALRLGGLDIRRGALAQSAASLEAAGVIPPGLAGAVADGLEEASARIGPGVLLGTAAPARQEAAPGYAHELPPRDAVAAVREAIARFRTETGAGRVVVIQLTSVEPGHPEAEALPTEEALEAFIDGADPRTPPSLIYALAAQDEGAGYLNFTPCAGAAPPAMRARARRLGVPHAGRDGKTGETLLKSVLGPMLRDRNLRVLSWAGYNILGNHDGRVLGDPDARVAKLRSKASVLRSILGDEGLGSEHVTIDYVPSLGDWKTAWDHVHFAGFLGTRMSLELTWRGCDSALAAPLVLDAARLLARCAAAGRAGLIGELACFFKDPLGCDEQAFPAQMELLRRLAAELGSAHA